MDWFRLDRTAVTVPFALRGLRNRTRSCAPGWTAIGSRVPCGTMRVHLRGLRMPRFLLPEAFASTHFSKYASHKRQMSPPCIVMLPALAFLEKEMWTALEANTHERCTALEPGNALISRLLAQFLFGKCEISRSQSSCLLAQTPQEAYTCSQPYQNFEV